MLSWAKIQPVHTIHINQQCIASLSALTLGLRTHDLSEISSTWTGVLIVASRFTTGLLELNVVKVQVLCIRYKDGRVGVASNHKQVTSVS
jgi:hypothetical protein